MAERALPVTILEPAWIDPDLLDHSLSLRFDLGQFDERITFTRNSSATYFGSDGLLKTAAANEPRIDYDPVTGECKGFLVEEQRTNLLTYSDHIDLWNRATASTRISNAEVVSVDGVLRMYKLESIDGLLATMYNQHTFPVTSGKTYVASLYAKQGNFNSIGITFRNTNAAGWQTGTIKLSEVYVADTSTGASWKFGGCDHVGNGIYRVWAYCTADQDHALGGIDVRISSDFGETLVAGSHVFIGKVQCEEGAFPTSYIPTPAVFTSRNSTGTYFDSTGVMKTAAINEARYDHALVDGKWVSKGLMLEGSSTNLHLYSENFSAGWSVTGEASLVGAAALSPDGTQTAGSFLCNTTNNATRRLYASANITVTPSTAYTASAYIKAVNWDWVGVGLAFGTGYITNCVLAMVNLSTGQTTLQYGTSVKLSDVGNGWYRVVVTGTTPETMTGARFSFVLLDADESIVNTAIGVVGAGIYVWGAQLEVGAQPTSYIKTEAAAITRAADLSTSSAATRAADSAVMTGENFSSWYRQDEGTIVAEFNELRVGSGVTGNAGVFDVRQSDKDPSNTRMLRGMTAGNGDLKLQINDANGISYNLVDAGGTLTSVNQFGKMGLAYKWGDSAVASELGLLSADRTLVGSTAIVAGLMYIGVLNNGAQFHSTRHIKRLTYYPKRLSNTQLQALTQ
jgi:hypothetical protein